MAVNNFVLNILEGVMPKFISVIFAGVLAVATLAPAYSQPRDETIQELIEAAHLLDQFQAMRDLLPQIMEQQFANSGTQLSPEKLEIIKEITVEMFSDMEGSMLALTIRLYQDNFTQSELEDLLAFYRSATGQKLVEKTPEMLAQVIIETNSLMVSLMPKMQAELTRRFEELEQDSTS